MRNRKHRKRSIAAILRITIGVGLVCSILACESMPMRAMRGARYYAQGSDALERGDTALAILELEHAAALVPQASEVQNHLGLAYWADGQPTRARLAFGRALELDCDNTAARRNLDTLETTIASQPATSSQGDRDEFEMAPKSTSVEPGEGENADGG